MMNEFGPIVEVGLTCWCVIIVSICIMLYTIKINDLMSHDVATRVIYNYNTVQRASIRKISY